MAPLYVSRHFYEDSLKYLNPEELQLVDSPFRTEQDAAQLKASVAVGDQTSKPPHKIRGSSQDHSAGKDAGSNSSLRFMVVGHPDQLKDKTQMRQNRIHVMHNYLAKEAQNPNSNDSRVHGSAQPSRRRRRSQKTPVQATSTGITVNQYAPSNIFRWDVSRLTPAESIRSSGSSNDASDGDSAGSATNKAPRVTKFSSIQRPWPNFRETPLHSGTLEDTMQPLVGGIGGGFENSSYMKASTLDVPFSAKTTTPTSFLDGNLEPFNVWPTFSDSSLRINELKWNCCQRFGSSSLSMHWIPTMLRARHAFLSTLTISSAYDDLMGRALLPAHQQNGESLITRIKVRQGVISLINESMNDPEMRAADETMIAVLHVLNSEIMGCDDRSMRVHQLGLHDMIRERGGLEKLGVGGQLASLLTITNHLIGALRETTPHRDFIDFASRQATSIPGDSRRLPESPVYCRPQGFRTIRDVLSTEGDTFDLLDTLRSLTNKFYVENQAHSRSTPSVFCDDRLQEPSEATVSDLYTKIFATRPAVEKEFDDMNDRYVFESIRLAALVYAHALSNKIPFSKAAAQVRSTSNASPDPNRSMPMPMQIKKALMRTDTSYCWGHLAGVLFWVALVAGAAANPGPLANEEREGEDEDARKWLTAIAVRCCIVLSFEYGHAVLETLKRVVAIETMLGRRVSDIRSWTPESFEDVSIRSGDEGHMFGPAEAPPLQRGFADFAEEFLSI